MARNYIQLNEYLYDLVVVGASFAGLVAAPKGAMDLFSKTWSKPKRKNRNAVTSLNSAKYLPNHFRPHRYRQGNAGNGAAEMAFMGDAVALSPHQAGGDDDEQHAI